MAPPLNLSVPDLITEVSFDGDPSATYTDSVYGDTPKVYYRLDEVAGTTATDTMGLVNGTYTGGYTLAQASALAGDSGDKSTSFNGSTGYVTIATNATIDAIVSAWSLEAWVYPTATRAVATDDACAIIARQYGGGATGIPFILGYGTFANVSAPANTAWVGYYTGTAWKGIFDTTTLPLNTWTYLVGTWDGTTLRFYRNGLQTNSTVPSAADVAAAASQGTYVGKRWDGAAPGTDSFFPGRIDEAAVSNVALSAFQVANHYRARDVLVAYTWTDISADVIDFSTSGRGRIYEIEKAEANILTLTLDDVGRKYDPANASSPYYPNVDALKMIRLRVALNELLNPDFESDASSWAAYQSATFAVDSAKSNTGTQSLQVTPSGSFAASGVISNAVTVVSGDEVRADAWVWSTSAQTLQLRVEEYDGGASFLRATTQAIVGTSGWQRVQKTVTTGASTASVKLALETDGASSTAFWVDTCLLKRVYPLYRGYVEGWPEVWEGTSYGRVQLTATDGFEPLAQALIQGTVPTGLSGACVTYVLNLASWPRVLRSIEAGQSTMTAIALSTGTNAKQVLQDLADSEIGLFFPDAAGRAIFQDRFHRITSALSTTVQAMFGDQDGTTDLEYADLKPSFDKQRIVNDWQVSPDPSVGGGAVQESTDDKSIRKYFRRTQPRSTHLATNADALAQSQYLVGVTAVPRERFETLDIEPLNNLTLWQQALQRDISDRIQVNRHPFGGSTLAQTCFIERVAVAGGVDSPWRFAWQLSPVQTTTYFTLDDSTRGKLDNDNVLAY